MTQSVYSWMGTPMHFVLDDDFANAFNRALDAFLDAQVKFKETHGRNWTGDDPILIQWTDEEKNAFNGVGEIINTIIKVQGDGIDIPEDQVTSDYLVKL